MEQSKRCVIVTGFGPFNGYDVNASWEAVRLLPELDIEKDLNVKLVTKQIPVAYESVTNIIPSLWSEYKPLFVIHVGVSGLANKITLEKLARKSGYNRTDVNGQLPPGGECCIGCEDQVCVSLDLDSICSQVNNSRLGPISCISSNAGRYLCEFIYYTSLSINTSRTLFIHVPDINKPFSLRELAEGLKEVIRVVIENVQQCDC